ncbi:ubiquitin fusion degradation protein 4 [[Candida] anglica]|uniref:HECT-type E3 ubiquitin transferase n=1 Tax=[Candida] anglica TaxID=148631 RepID=A0ABP0EHK5_9ASCO
MSKPRRYSQRQDEREETPFVDTEMETSDVEAVLEDEDDDIYFGGNGEVVEEDDHEVDQDDDDVADDDHEDDEYGDEDEEDGDALWRLSQQAMRRRESSLEEDDVDGVDEDIDNDEDNDNDSYDDEEDLNPADFLRRLISARSRQDGFRGLDEPYEEGDVEDGNATANPGSGRGAHRSADAGAGGPPSEFVDVIHRLMGGGIMFGGPHSSEIDGLINNLNQRDDPYLILETLNELSERLLMMNGITAERVIPAAKLAKTLISILTDVQLSEDLEVHLVACRCLYNFLEVNQDFIHEVLTQGAVEALCEKLMEISYIDLTEQALQTLEMISRDPMSHGQIIQANGLKACLQYLDFFTVHAQRKALIIVANACNGVNSRNFVHVKEVFGNISSVVREHEDSIVLENGWLAISRCVLRGRSDGPDRGELEKIFVEEGLIEEMIRKGIEQQRKEQSSDSSNSTSLPFGICLSIIKSLVSLSDGIEVCKILLEKRIGEVIVNSLKRYSSKNELNSSSNTITISSLMSCPKELLLQYLTLIGKLIPENEIGTTAETGLRRDLCMEIIPKEFEHFLNDIWLFHIISFESSMDVEIRKKILANILKIVEKNDKDGQNEIVQRIAKIEEVGALLASVCSQGLKGHREMLMLSFKIIKRLLEAGTFLLGRFQREGLEQDVERIMDEIKNDPLYIEKAADPAIVDVSLDHSSIPSIDAFDSSNLRSLNFNQRSSTSNANNLIALYSLGTSVISLFNSDLSGSSSTATSNTTSSSYHIDQIIKQFAHNPDWTSLFQQLSLIFEPNDNHSISSFELVSSGIIESLVKLFSSDESGYSSECYQNFIKYFFLNEPSINTLIEKLQECLTRSETFDIVSSASGNSSTSASFAGNGGALRIGSSKTAIMARQVKIKLEGQDARQGPMKDFVLSVHAIATFKSVDTFLKSRLRIWEELSHGRGSIFGGLGRNIPGRDGSDEEMEDEDDVDRDEDEERENDHQEEKLKNNSQSDDNEDSHLEFSINGEVIPNETTIYGAIYQSLQDGKDSMVNPDRIWSGVHKVSFRKVSGPSPDVLTLGKRTVGGGLHGISEEMENDEIMNNNNITISILKLLRILFDMNEVVGRQGTGKMVPLSSFKNWKLTVKLNRQLEEPLVVASGTLPGWSVTIPKQFPFIFPLDTRMFFLQSTSFGYSRLIHNWQLRMQQEEDSRDSGAEGSRNGSNSGNSRPPLGRPARHKVRLSRKSMLQSAVKVLGMYGSTPGVLEIEYFDEVGSGLGPTLEFYSTVSHEFASKKLHLWRQDSEEKNDLYIRKKLFPYPMDKSKVNSDNGRKVLFFFAVLGKFVARAMLDSRIMDFNFNPVFLKLVQLEKNEVKRVANLGMLREVDEGLATSLEGLLKYSTIDGPDQMQDLALTFELPGYPSYQLIPDGSNVPVTSSNVESYVEKVVEATLFNGVIHQVRAFMDGFSKVFPVNSLAIFSAIELCHMFGNAEEDWSTDTLFSVVNADHGYTKESVAIKRLVGILANFDKVERRSFLQFLTGAPKLPVGGFKSLRPELTVVKKSADDGLKDDDYLPSVMTCANYLKLPNYSSEDIMKQKLLQAMSEGAGAFLLS